MNIFWKIVLVIGVILVAGAGQNAEASKYWSDDVGGTWETSVDTAWEQEEEIYEIEETWEDGEVQEMEGAESNEALIVSLEADNDVSLKIGLNFTLT